MKVTDRLFQHEKEYWESFFKHPFVAGIADGTLPIEKFQFYMIQDHKYLMQYAKVFALGVLKATDEADMRTFSGLITATLDTENAVHQSYLRKLGISREQITNTPTSIVTDSYTNYMISMSVKEGLAELMTAVLACSWTYKLIGDFMETIPGAQDQEFYGTWIRMYSSEGYRKANDEMIELVDKYTEGYSEKQLQNLEHILHLCSRYEEQFWDMAWNLQL